MGRDRRGWDNVLFAPSSGGRGGNGYVFRYFLFSILLFPSSHCSYFPIISFFAKIINRRAGAGPDRTDAGGDRNAGRDGGGATGTCYVIFCSLLCSFLLLTLLLFQLSAYDNRRGGTERDVKGPTRAVTATRDGTEGQAGEKRR